MRITEKQVEQAVKATAGNVMAAARQLGCARSTLYRKIEASDYLKDVLSDTREELIDIAESALRKEVLNGNIAAIIFTLKTQGKGRGYIERHEHAHEGIAGGSPIEVRIVDYRKGLEPQGGQGENKEDISD